MEAYRKLLIIVFSVLALAGGVATAAWVSSLQTTESDLPSETSEEVRLTARIDGPETFSYGDELRVVMEVENISSAAQTYTFASGCTDPTIFVDEQETMLHRFCTTALTDVTLQPGEKQEYTAEFILVEQLPEDSPQEAIEFNGQLALEPGMHSLSATWIRFDSEVLNFELVE